MDLGTKEVKFGLGGGKAELGAMWRARGNKPYWSP